MFLAKMLLRDDRRSLEQDTRVRDIAKGIEDKREVCQSWYKERMIAAKPPFSYLHGAFEEGAGSVYITAAT